MFVFFSKLEILSYKVIISHWWYIMVWVIKWFYLSYKYRHQHSIASEHWPFSLSCALHALYFQVARSASRAILVRTCILESVLSRSTSTCGLSIMMRVNGRTHGNSNHPVSSTTRENLYPLATKTDASCLLLELADESVLEKFWLRTGCSSLLQHWCSGFTLSRRTVRIFQKLIRDHTIWG